MFVFNRIPPWFLAVIGVTLLSSITAVFEGQAVAATVWGWWIMFRYPMLAVFAYLQPHWPEQFSKRIRYLVLFLLTLNVGFQGLQYLGGEIPGDNLAGAFGRHGVGALTMFTMLAICLALGQWLATGKATELMWALAMGAIGSGLGEMKVYPAAILALGIAAVVIHIFRGGKDATIVDFL